MNLFGKVQLGMNKQAFAQNFDKEQEKQWAKEYQNGDQMALRKLRYSMDGIIKSVVRQKLGSYTHVTDIDLLIAAEKNFPDIIKIYEPSKGELNTHVINRLQYLLGNEINESYGGLHVSRPDRVKLNEFRRAKREAEAEFGGMPTDTQIYSFVKKDYFTENWDEFQRVKKYDKVSPVGDATFGSKSNEGDDIVLTKDLHKDVIGYDPNDDLDAMKLDRYKQLAKQQLTPQEYEIVDKTLFQGITRIKVALSMGLSSSQLANAIKKWDEIVKSNPV